MVRKKEFTSGKEPSKLSLRQLRVLPYLLTSSSYEKAAQRSGVSYKQLQAWLQEPLFQKEVTKQQNALFWDAFLVLKIAAVKAAQTLVSSLNDADSKVRLAAAEQILSKTFQEELYELKERLHGVEESIENRSKKLVNKQWIARLEAIESKSEALSSDDLLDKWISKNCAGKNWSYLEIVNVVPNMLRDICFRRAMNELESENFTTEGRAKLP